MPGPCHDTATAAVDNAVKAIEDLRRALYNNLPPGVRAQRGEWLGLMCADLAETDVAEEMREPAGGEGT